MGHIFFLARTYSPDAASDIRYRSFLGGFKDADVTFVYMLPDEKKSRLVTDYDNIKVVNLWEEYCPSNNVLKHIFFYCQLLKFVFSLNEHLEYYKVPTRFIPVKELPRNKMGKLLRDQLK